MGETQTEKKDIALIWVNGQRVLITKGMKLMVDGDLVGCPDRRRKAVKFDVAESMPNGDVKLHVIAVRKREQQVSGHDDFVQRPEIEDYEEYFYTIMSDDVYHVAGYDIDEALDYIAGKDYPSSSNSEDRVVLPLHRVAVEHDGGQWGSTVEKYSRYAVSGVVLAGGAVISLLHGDKPRDIDFFLLNDGGADAGTKRRNELVGVLQKSLGYGVGTETPYFTSLGGGCGPEVQVISAQAQDVTGLLDAFDFRCCMLGIYEGDLIGTRGAIRDALEQELRVVNVSNPQRMLRRAIKYGQRGFTSPRDDKSFEDWLKGHGVVAFDDSKLPNDYD